MSRADPRVIVKQYDDDLLNLHNNEHGFLEACVQADHKPLRFEIYQAALLYNKERFRSVVKSRRVGFSFWIACEALARCHLRANHTSVIVSYSQKDAQEKIYHARRLYETMPVGIQKPLDTDSKSELWFKTPKGTSRIIAMPCKAVRGIEGDLYLDEFAHYPDDQGVYQGSLAVLLREPNAQVTVGSTPLGKRGVLHEIATKPDRHPMYQRREFPWWLSELLTTDRKRAAKEAWFMPTTERVKTFGGEMIQQLLLAQDLQHFQQEFECCFLDDSSSYFSYDLILTCCLDLELPEDLKQVEVGEGRLVAGYDVGRVRDASELFVFEQVDDHYVPRFRKTFRAAPFHKQEGFLRRVLQTLRLSRLSIDASGLGRNLAENLERDFGDVVRPEHFTAQSKERWVPNVKILLEQGRIALPHDRDLIRQIHSIRKKISPSGNVLFESPKDRHGHADAFWAMALAVQREQLGAEQDDGPSLTVSSLNLHNPERRAAYAELRRSLGLDTRF